LIRNEALQKDMSSRQEELSAMQSAAPLDFGWENAVFQFNDGKFVFHEYDKHQ